MGSLNLFILISSSVLVCVSAQLSLNENTPRRLFDDELYANVIDNEECARQVTYMQREDQTMLFGRFLDAGIRIPRGIFMLNFNDLGNYDQCLAITEKIDDMQIDGKYCFISVPFDQTFQLPFNRNLSTITPNNSELLSFGPPINEVQRFVNRIDLDADSLNPENPLLFGEVKFALCIPKVCTTQHWMTNVLFNLTAFGFKYEDQFCRLPNDKPWVPVDYVAIGIFSFLGLITLLSTMYDINHIVIKKRDPKKANIFFRTFSVFTNTRRLLTFSPNSNSLECLDGIRSISMMWVVLGHTFSMHNFNANLTQAILWLTSGNAVFVSTGLFTVDSFFLMAGLLLVYSSVGKMTGTQLLKRLHAFYLNRGLRMFPLLAALILLEASVFHRIADGPYWVNVARNAQRCRSFWWSTLLHVANYVNPDDICIQHSWYIAIDIQLHFISPIILYWVLSKNKRAAWTALVAGLLAVTIVSTVWNFIKELPASNMSIVRLDEQAYYMNNYYMLAWTRAAPFFIGMILGYILNVYKGKKLKLNMGFVVSSWVVALGAIASCFYTSYMIMQLDWDNQVGDSLFNSYMRTVWSFGLSWIIFACVKGYGGPINWLLSLNLWKVPARVSFAMYLYHYSINFIVAGSQRSPVALSGGDRMYDFMAILTLSFIVSFVVTIVIDAPFSVLIKMLMEGGQRRPRKPTENGVNASKPGGIPEKNVADLERPIVTTLIKNDPGLEKSPLHLEKNGIIPDNTVTLDRIEELGEPYTKSKEMSKF